MLSPSRSTARLSAAVLVATLAACADSGDSSASADTAADAAVETSPDATVSSWVETFGAYRAELSDPGPWPVGVTRELHLMVTMDGEVASDFTPTVTFIHAVEGHAGTTTPTAELDHDGHFFIGHLTPSMAGPWRLTVDFGASGTVSWEIEVGS
ncbi:MAG: hypothetical protein U1F43_30675 [Myxococcota bacterium]